MVMGKAEVKLAKAELIERSIALVREGKTYRQISNALSVSVGAAHGYVQEGIKAIPAEEAALLRTQEAMRLEMLWEKVVDRIESSRVEAFDADGEPIDVDVDVDRHIEAARKISESRRKLFGLDAPQQVQGQFTVSYQINGVNPEALR